MKLYYEADFPVEEIRAEVAGKAQTGIRLDQSGMEACLAEARETDTEVDGGIFSGLFSSLNLSDIAFTGTTFLNCRFQDCDFRHTSFLNCVFLDSDFSNCSLERLWCSASSFLASKGVGANFQDARLNRVRFAQCDLRYANFGKARFQSAVLQDSNFTESSFQESLLKEMKLIHSTFTRAEFFKTPLKQVDLTDCETAGLLLSDSLYELRGAVVNLTQAAELARKLGVVIR